jgi:UDP-N-acetylglucosamine 4-epimerase
MISKRTRVGGLGGFFHLHLGVCEDSGWLSSQIHMRTDQSKRKGMTSTFDTRKSALRSKPGTWLVTGVAGFIGSNLLEELLKLEQRVIGIDNFSTGRLENLQEVQRAVSPENWEKFKFFQADIRELDKCREAAVGVDFVLHQAALGSVPRSMEDPIVTNQCNIDGFLNMLVAARDAEVKRFVYAASSSTYGDHPGLPKVEGEIGKPLSPYAVTKYVNELYADVFARAYGMETIGLRYFNVFGKRQDPNGAYAAVIPKWIGQLLNHQSPVINGDGETSRDFCYIENVIQANFLAATSQHHLSSNRVFNIAYGERTTLNELYTLIREGVAKYDPQVESIEVSHGPERGGDVKHSLADISLARLLLQFDPPYGVKAGMDETIPYYINSHLDQV